MNVTADALAFDITCVDVNYLRPRLACSYLVIQNGKAAFIDCGTSHSIPHLIEALHNNELTRDDVEFIIPTHVHLDHAGGAGALMTECPNATLVVHPKGAPHLIDPQRLIESTKQVYGEEKFNQLYGKIVPIDSQRVLTPEDDTTIELNGRELLIAHTPGHARHHFCIYDNLSSGWFTGDTFGLSYPDINCNSKHYLLPTTTPVQFEPDAWLTSIQRLLSTKPKRMYLTHFGMVEEIELLAEKLRQDLNSYVDIALALKDSSQRIKLLIEHLTQFTFADLHAHGNQQNEDELLQLLANDIKLNAQGLDVWLTRRDKANKTN